MAARLVLALLIGVNAIGMCAGQRSRSTQLKVTLAQEFTQSSVQAVSPDGTRLCLRDWAERGSPLRVLEIGTWRTLYTGRFAAPTTGAGFFADSRTLMVVYPIASRAIIDLSTGTRTTVTEPYNARQRQGDNLQPAGDRTLLKTHWESPPEGYETKTLSLVAMPDDREIVKVPYPTEPRKPRPMMGGIPLSTEGPLVLSDSRKVLAYSFDNIIVWRRTDDLALLWTKAVDVGLEAYRLAVSADGSRVAASLADRANGQLPRQYYIGIYESKTGAEVARLPLVARSPLVGSQGIALSSDGKLAAVVSQEPGEKGKVVPTVSIYDASSGQKLTSVTHGPIKRGRHQWLEAGCTVGFTSDGKYMVTSGMATRIWRIEY